MLEPGLYVVATPLGNLDDVSDRARDALAGVDVVYAEDTRRTGRLLEALGRDVPLRSLHEHNEAERTEELAGRLREGGRVALVSDAGTPTVSDPGRRAVAAALEAGLRVVPIPGPSAVTAALSVSGLPADRFALLGFPPRSGADREAWLDRSASLPMTVVAFESPRRAASLLRDWEDRGLGGRTCVLCREMTKMHEEVLRAPLAELRDRVEGRELKGEVTLVLEGRDDPEDGERPPEVARSARRLLERGWSTRDVADHLGAVFGVARNEAYETALELGEEKGRG